MVDISSQNNKINVTVSSSGNTANTNVTPDYAKYYSEKSKEWAISDKLIDNEDYSSKYYANESKKQADISTAKATEVIESGNTAVSNIESARNNAILDVNTAGAIQVALATEQATIATNKASEVVASGNEALSNIDTAKDSAITSITNQETTSKTVLIDEGATQIGLIQNEGATQVANVQSTGFYMRDDKLYYINSQGKETEFKLDDIELNNPYSLFDSKYSDHELNNLSWLKSEGQWNAKAVYPTAYDKLLKVYNGTETVVGLSVKLSTETYTDYDFVLNTADETFRLPLKTLHSDDTVDSLSLYFYVGETVQNANLIDAGRIGEQLANKQDKCIHIIDTYVNGTSGYRIWSDGYCEQWGRMSGTSVTYLKQFKDTNYNLIMGYRDYNSIGAYGTNYSWTSSTTGFTKGNAGTPIEWKACGYLANGEY